MALAFLPHEIVGTFVEHTISPRQRQIDCFAAKGITKWSIAGAPNTGEFPVAFSRASRLDDGRFDFDPEGEPVLCAIALDEFRDPADIVAAGRGWLAAWLGRSAMLGEQHLADRPLGGVLPIYQSVMAWLQAARDGIVLVDKKRAVLTLHDADPFLATGGFEHAAELVALLAPRPPQVLVPLDERRAA